MDYRTVEGNSAAELVKNLNVETTRPGDWKVVGIVKDGTTLCAFIEGREPAPSQPLKDAELAKAAEKLEGAESPQTRPA